MCSMSDFKESVASVVRILEQDASGMQGLVFIFGADRFAKVVVGGIVAYPRCKHLEGESYSGDIMQRIEEKLANQQTFGVKVTDEVVFQHLCSTGLFENGSYVRNGRSYRYF